MSGQRDESVDTAGSAEDGLLGGNGLDRRSLIKKAGVVGAAAWVAPMVLDSVLSPASAASLPPGKYKLRLSTQRCNPTPVQDPNVAQACLPPDWPAATNAITDETMLANLGLSVSNCDPRYALTLVSSKANVTILSGTACRPKTQGGGPHDGVVSNAGAQITWDNSGASDRNGYFIVINVA
jgi:hypothetical protein